MKEIFKDIPGYENIYQVSNMGNVYTIKRKKYRKPKINKDGYYYLFLNKKGKTKGFLVHRLVAEVFIDKSNYKKMPNENEKLEYLLVNHIDENKLNNNVDNLEWCTLRYNVNYSKGKKISKKEKLFAYLEKAGIDDKIKKDIYKIFK